MRAALVMGTVGLPDVIVGMNGIVFCEGLRLCRLESIAMRFAGGGIGAVGVGAAGVVDGGFIRPALVRDAIRSLPNWGVGVAIGWVWIVCS